MRKTRFLLAWAIKRRTDEDFFRKRRLKVKTQNKLRFNKLTQYQPIREKLFSFFLQKSYIKHLVVSKIVVPLQPQSREKATKQKHNGALVQLVRIHACHAWGHGFESRTHRESK